MRHTTPDAAIHTEILADIPALGAETNATAADLLRSLGIADGGPVAFATDGAILQAAGLPVVLRGPGSMTQGHQSDEYIEHAELQRCDALMTRIAAAAAA